MDFIYEEYGVYHPWFLMKKQAEHQHKSHSTLSLWSTVVLRLGIICYVSHTFQNNFENAGDSVWFPGSWCYRDSCIFNFFKKKFLDRSRASSKCCSCHRRYSTCPTARRSIWDGESILLRCCPFITQNLTHTALIYSPRQAQVYPWCPSSQLCMGSLWWDHHLELPLALVYR